MEPTKFCYFLPPIMDYDNNYRCIHVDPNAQNKMQNLLKNKYVNFS